MPITKLIVHTIASTRLDHGGTSRSVPATCNALNRIGCKTHLVTARPVDLSIPLNLLDDASLNHIAVESKFIRQWNVGKQFRQSLESLRNSEKTLLVHDHAIWLPSNHAVASYCKSHRVARIVSPRGMLGQWPCDMVPGKRNSLGICFKKRDLQLANGFHATSQQELEEIRSHGFAQPAIVLPNAIEIPNQEYFRTEDPKRPTALFLSRLHPKKGLVELVRAWAAAMKDSNWRLILAGPDEAGYRVTVEEEAARLGLHECVEFLGNVEGEAKWKLYANADLFVLPSFNENYGIVIAEAMAMGVPVITTTGTPWSVLRENHLGWWVDPQMDAIAQALREVRGMDRDELRQMGTRSKQYMELQMSWNKLRAISFPFTSA